MVIPNVKRKKEYSPHDHQDYLQQTSAAYWERKFDMARTDLGSQIGKKMLWIEAAQTLMEFIQNNVAIVGFDEIEGYRKCKEAMKKAQDNG